MRNAYSSVSIFEGLSEVVLLRLRKPCVLRTISKPPGCSVYIIFIFCPWQYPFLHYCVQVLRNSNKPSLPYSLGFFQAVSRASKVLVRQVSLSTHCYGLYISDMDSLDIPSRLETPLLILLSLALGAGPKVLEYLYRWGGPITVAPHHLLNEGDPSLRVHLAQEDED